LAQLHQLDWRLLAENADVYEAHPARLLEETIAPYRSLYTRFNLTGFLQVTDWLDSHKSEIAVHPAGVHQDFHANNVFLCSDGRWAVMDWTQFAVSDYRIDLCWTLLIMGDFGNPEWRKQILRAYASHSNQPMEQIDYFGVIVIMKLLASTTVSFLFGPEEVGLRPETLETARRQISIYHRLYQRLRTITGLTVPELGAVFEKWPGGARDG
jgi:aminoglycoside phosphotransferase (APT) family kinase protein